MTENRLCSDPLPAQAMHNGFSNTKSLIMVQLVNLKYESNKERQNKKPFWFFSSSKKRKRKGEMYTKIMREKKCKVRTKCVKKERKREILVSIYSMLFQSPITLQVSSCDLGGFDRNDSPW